MYEDEKNKFNKWFAAEHELNKWFAAEERCLGTHFNGEEYVVSELEVEDLCDFLREQYPDLIGIPCMVGTCGIWFTSDNLKKAIFLQLKMMLHVRM